MKSKSTMSLDDVLSGKVKLPKGLILDNVNGKTIIRMDGGVTITRHTQSEIDNFMYELNGEMPGMEKTPKEHKVRNYLANSLETIRASYAKLAETLKPYIKK